MTPLTDDEKREIVELFLKLEALVSSGADSDRVQDAVDRLRTAYRGNTKLFIDGWNPPGQATEQWVRQLQTYLYDEIDAAFWKEGFRERLRPGDSG